MIFRGASPRGQYYLLVLRIAPCKGDYANFRFLRNVVPGKPVQQQWFIGLELFFNLLCIQTLRISSAGNSWLRWSNFTNSFIHQCQHLNDNFMLAPVTQKIRNDLLIVHLAFYRTLICIFKANDYVRRSPPDHRLFPFFRIDPANSNMLVTKIKTYMS